MKKYLLIMIPTIFIVFFAFKEQKPMDVQTIKPQKTVVYNHVIARGHITQAQSEHIAININGKVEDIYVKKNDYIKKGDLLLTIKKESVNLSEIDMKNIRYVLNTTVLDVHDEKEVYIYSTIDGKVIDIPQNTGEPIIGGIPFLTIAKKDGYQAKVEISENYINKVQSGQPVKIVGKTFENTLSGVVQQVDSYTKTSFDLLNQGKDIMVEATINIQGVPSSMIVGSSVEAKIVVDKINDALVVPYEAIRQEGHSEYVLVIQDGVATKKNIQTGYELTDTVQVIDGITIADEIILTSDVKEGSLVE